MESAWLRKSLILPGAGVMGSPRYTKRFDVARRGQTLHALAEDMRQRRVAGEDRQLV
jgi:hypothetical protein